MPGYSSHASYVLEERKAESEERVHSFLSLLYEGRTGTNKDERFGTTGANSAWRKTYQKMRCGIFNWKTKTKTAWFDEQVKPYFELTQVLKVFSKLWANLWAQLLVKKDRRISSRCTILCNLPMIRERLFHYFIWIFPSLWEARGSLNDFLPISK